MVFKQVLVLFFLFLVVAFILWVFYGIFSSLFCRNIYAMYVPSFNRHIRLMKQLTLSRGKKIIDLGCGDGKAMRFFAETFGLQCDGYELQRFPYLYGKLINRVLGYKTLKIYKQNFSQANLKHYDYIYTYLLPEQMADIESRIFQNIKSDAIIISNSFQFAIHTPYKVIKDKHGKPSIFLYKK